MERQLWVGHKGLDCARERLQPVRNRDRGFNKPTGGLWTSTHGEPYGWLAWLEAEQWAFGTVPESEWSFWLLDVDPGARIYTIGSHEELDWLTRRFPAPEGFRNDGIVDWEGVARDFDGVRLTSLGELAEAHLDFPLSLGWDCKSTLWFRWAFTSAEKIERSEAKASSWQGQQ